jgi:hypothetical protein
VTKKLPHLIVGLALLAIPSRVLAEEKDKPVTVPFELLKTGHMAIMVKVEGKGPYRVIFDTGAPINLLNNKVAKEAGLLKNMEKPLFSLFGTMGQVNVGTLEVGGLKAKKVNTIVMDHPTVEAISKVLGPIEGIVGFPFFARYKMTIDYQAKKLTFVPNGFDPPDVMQTLMVTLMAMSQDKGAPIKVLAPAGQWGMVAYKDADDENDGVVIKEVYAGGPADKGGLKTGDRLLTLDDRWTDSVTDLYAAAGKAKPGEAVKVVVRRAGKELELTVKPGSGL